jgi:hypothetical protein
VIYLKIIVTEQPHVQVTRLTVFGSYLVETSAEAATVLILLSRFRQIMGYDYETDCFHILQYPFQITVYNNHHHIRHSVYNAVDTAYSDSI